MSEFKQLLIFGIDATGTGPSCTCSSIFEPCKISTTQIVSAESSTYLQSVRASEANGTMPSND
ncbi:uncharacterized protein MYCFIDRAFT_209595 [Pseudocercospora fijiensis CIRAD86]|uniref:Uncharacterized protein n=1 Tax=Pseudocercospora fijiensis (strain CIRAD86) TaxID=383855 RepID=N1Q7R5_PSEFD|nr:uncharacterized protein MYCFIDRAFT_209595 [Pseudocercospora fijiensis CIRAD86]EME87716.1 hypothetical protein MYCFIDRAFT_209595 [Pseudocercospora fijiensis CIRAD86]